MAKGLRFHTQGIFSKRVMIWEILRGRGVSKKYWMGDRDRRGRFLFAILLKRQEVRIWHEREKCWR